MAVSYVQIAEGNTTHSQDGILQQFFIKHYVLGWLTLSGDDRAYSTIILSHTMKVIHFMFFLVELWGGQREREVMSHNSMEKIQLLSLLGAG